MKHYGDITKIKGSEVPIVDIVTGGSPCQDLSVAGKRAGLEGERSGLFMEQIRIIKEMRDYDRNHRQGATDGRSEDDIRPRYMVWENVPGAFSSNKGEDFRAVLEETAKVAEGDACIPGPPDGRWPHSGCIVADGWSIAWRVHDAQFWGVPQRRKRIALVADFGGWSAAEILFERKGVSGDSPESGKAGEGVATDVRNSVTESSRAISFQERAGKPGGGKGILIQDEHTGALSTLNNQSVCYGISSYESNAMKSSNPHSGIYAAETSRTLDNNGGNPACNQGGMAVVCYRKKGHPQNAEQGQGWEQTEINDTLNAFDNGESRTPTVVCYDRFSERQNGVPKDSGDMSPTVTAAYGTSGNNTPLVMTMQAIGEYKERDVASGLKARDYKDATDLIVYGLDAVCTKGDNDAETRNQILRLLQETYGAKTIEEWGVAVMVALQSSKVLQQGMYESSIQGKTENRQELDDGSLPCPSVVAEWLLRDMRQREECGCPPQGRESSEQRFKQFDEGVPELSQQNSQTCKDLFDMWKKGQGVRLLQQALHQIQKIWESVNVPRPVVRRLTPLEAERLQGYPDGWTDIGDWVDSKGKKRKGESDSPRYKALGNSIALPFWEWMAERMLKHIDHDRPTMASLFDGIGGFPLVYSRHGCEPVWASEIEEFPIAVTKIRFPESEDKECPIV